MTNSGKIDKSSSSRLASDTDRHRSKPDVALHRRGNGAVLETLDGRSQYPTGIASKPPSSRGAARRLQMTVPTKLLCCLADQHQLGDAR